MFARRIGLAMAMTVLALVPATPPPPAPTEPQTPAVRVSDMAALYRGADATVRHTGDGSPSGDAEADAAFAHAERVVAYFHERFGRDSYDGRATTLIVYVRDVDRTWLPSGRAEWNRELQQIELDAGYVTLDLIAHEFTHGVVQEIGEDAPTDPYRDLADPARFGHPTHMRDYDRAGTLNVVHSNSTIISHAYYRLAVAIGRDPAQQIVWTALTRFLEPGSGFDDFRDACIAAAIELHCADSQPRHAVVEAFRAVGFEPRSAESPRAEWRRPIPASPGRTI